VERLRVYTAPSLLRRKRKCEEYRDGVFKNYLLLKKVKYEKEAERFNQTIN
jgi:hypothetical protein